jgi:perosamine synthetase
MIKNLACYNDKTLLDAMKLINKNGLGVCFIVDKNDSIKGIATDGDIRRAILNNKDLNSPIEEIINKNFIYGHTDDTTETLINKIIRKNDEVKISILPIVDNNHKLVDYFRYLHHTHFPVASPNLDGNEFKYLTDAFFSTWISSSGYYIGLFEESFSSYSDCKYGVAVSSGTTAIHLALVALGIGEGDEVIVPDLTFAATINAVLHANATPVIVDIDSQSWCIDSVEIENAITPKTKAIIPVHLFGQVCDMDSIMILAKKYNLRIIEDCAEAHGAEFKNNKVGSFGDIGCFSFYGNKVLTTGEGGMCTTNSSKINDQLRLFRDHGMSKSKRYFHEVIGFNYRMTNLQAAIGVGQLERIDEIHKNRSSYESLYKKVMSGKPFEFQKNLKNRKKITWLVSIFLNGDINDRDKLMSKFKEKGIDARPFFYPLSDMPIYKKYCLKETPIAKKISSRGINLPTYESLKSLEEIEEILYNILES